MRVKENLMKLAWRLRIGGYPLALLATALACACSSQPGHAPTELATVKQQVERGEAVLVDVRGPAEWYEGHVTGAISLPTKAIAPARGANDKARLDELLAALPKGKPLYCHCVKGVRALAVAKILADHGYEAQALKPGFDELISAGFEPQPPATAPPGPAAPAE
jgi:rhodanese-related sulfurtransferase